MAEAKKKTNTQIVVRQQPTKKSVNHNNMSVQDQLAKRVAIQKYSQQVQASQAKRLLHQNGNKSSLLKIDPGKAEKYRKEGELRLREQILREQQAKNATKKKERKNKKKLKKESEGSWWSTIKEVGGEILKYGVPLLMGMGDYEEDDKMLKQQDMPESNSLLAVASNGDQGTSVPSMHKQGNKIRVQHREYLGDVYSTTSEFETYEFPINPGMNETNPWLAPIANQFTGYNYLGQNAVFVSEGSEYSNSVGLGYVAMAYQYNVVDPVFDSKRDMLNSQFAVSAKPSKSFPCWMECKPSDRIMDHLFVRSGEVPANTDKRLYDASKLVLAVGGHSTSGVVLGELWITYDIELLIPKSSVAQNPNQLQCALVGPVTSASFPFGPSTTMVPSLSYYNTFTITPSASSTFLWPKGYAGTYDITYTWTCSNAITTAAALPTFAYSSNFTQSTLLTFGVGMTSAGGSCSFGVKHRVQVSDKAGSIVTTPGSFAIYGATTMTFVCQQIALINKESTSIFDIRGGSRSERYKSMMEDYRVMSYQAFINKSPKPIFEAKSPEIVSCYPIVMRETSSFTLWSDEHSDEFVSVYQDKQHLFPVPDEFPNHEVVDSWSDETFNVVCKGIIDRQLIPRGNNDNKFRV